MLASDSDFAALVHVSGSLGQSAVRAFVQCTSMEAVALESRRRFKEKFSVKLLVLEGREDE